MMWGYYGGLGWIWMAAVMVLFWGGIIVLGAFVIRSFTGTKASDPAMDILRRRLANGEITPDEFEKMRKALQG